MPQLLYPQEKSPEYPFSRRLNGLQIESGDCVEEKNLLLLPGTEP